MYSPLKKLIAQEHNRQKKIINLIASENFVSREILKAVGSALTNKYAEGYPLKRYYEGCEIVDKIEILAIEELKKLFSTTKHKVAYANVQPHSGSQANAAAYLALLQPGDKVLAMDLKAGGHLTHGSKVNFSGQFYQFFHYGVNLEGFLDYEHIRKMAIEIKPKLIVCGASAYSRKIDFKIFRNIADEVGAYLLTDIAHIAGLIVAGLHESPVGIADIITFTTHKTLRGARGGVILAKEEFGLKIDKAVFPGIQGGPLLHVIAGKLQTFYEASLLSFKKYQMQIIKNAQSLTNVLLDNHVEIITGGTDNHLLMINVKSSFGITGLVAVKKLKKVGIICNMNVIPNDLEKPTITSGIRLGTPAMTTLGYKEKEFKQIGELIVKTLQTNNDQIIIKIKQQVKTLINSKK
jgi:glycine hydroxymethyltransferase